MSEVRITVSGPVGCGKSALLGEIEIMCKALGVPVRYKEAEAARAEKNMTHAEWTAELEMYKPSVVLVEHIDRAGQHPTASTQVLDTPEKRAANALLFDMIGKSEWDLNCAAEHLKKFADNAVLAARASASQDTAPPAAVPAPGKTIEQERADFECWYLERSKENKIGTDDCAKQWAAWLARSGGNYSAPSDWKISPQPWGLSVAAPAQAVDARWIELVDATNELMTANVAYDIANTTQFDQIQKAAARLCAARERCDNAIFACEELRAALAAQPATPARVTPEMLDRLAKMQAEAAEIVREVAAISAACAPAGEPVAGEWMAWCEVKPEIAPVGGGSRIGVCASNEDAENIVAAHNAVVRERKAAPATVKDSLPVAPAGEPVAVELQGVKEQISEGDGFWRPCSGCYETVDGHAAGVYPYSNVLRCALGGGCHECGGIGAVWDNTDYEAMADYMQRENEKVAAPVANAGQEQAVAVPDGWRLVPVEPTHLMIGAGARAMLNADPKDYTNSLAMTRICYPAMLAAAPLPQQVAPEPVCFNHNCNQGRDCPLHAPTSRDAYDSMTPERKAALDADLQGLEQRIESHRRSRERRTHDEPVAEDRRKGDRRHAQRRDSED